MPRNNNKTPRATEIMNAVLKLRSSGASTDTARNEAWRLFPEPKQTDNGYRARMMRLFEAPQQYFDAAAVAFADGKNINEIVALIPSNDLRGAPPGNKRGRAKRTQPINVRLDALWREANDAERALFLRQHHLTYN